MKNDVCLDLKAFTKPVLKLGGCPPRVGEGHVEDGRRGESGKEREALDVCTRASQLIDKL